MGLNIYSPDIMDKIIKGGVTKRQSCRINHQWETLATYNDDPMCDSKTNLKESSEAWRYLENRNR